MQEHSLHQEGSDLGGSPKGGEGNPSGQTPMGTPVLTQQVEADCRDETIQSFAQNILRLSQECRALADENKELKAEVERLRKAGDYLADHLAHEFGTCPSIEIWNAAKEGKPSV